MKVQMTFFKYVMILKTILFWNIYPWLLSPVLCVLCAVLRAVCCVRGLGPFCFFDVFKNATELKIILFGEKMNFLGLKILSSLTEIRQMHYENSNHIFKYVIILKNILLWNIYPLLLPLEKQIKLTVLPHFEGVEE